MNDEFKILASLHNAISHSQPGQEQQLDRFSFLQSMSMVQMMHPEPVPCYLEEEIDKVYEDFFNYGTEIKLTPEEQIDKKSGEDFDAEFLSYDRFKKFMDFADEQQNLASAKTTVISKDNLIKIIPPKKSIHQFANVVMPSHVLVPSNVVRPLPQEDSTDKITQGFISANTNKFKKRNKDDQTELDDSIQRDTRRFKPPSKVGDTGMKVLQPQFQKQKNTKQDQDPRLKNLDPALIERIESEIIDSASQTVGWESIAGLDNVRSQIEEVAIWPLMNPSLFEGITQPGRGLLLFGPPGTGKTMIGKAIANQAKATFFSISASSLTSKWIGEAEKLVRTLFTLASIKQPSVIFIDEVDSLLSARSDKENEGSRSMKTEFMVQLEGASKSGGDRVIFIGATNRPQELDDAIRRRFQKRLYIPLPNQEGRAAQFKIILEAEEIRGKMNDLSLDDIGELVKLTVGYSGADVKNLCTEAFFIPIRQAIRVNNINIQNLKLENIRRINLDDFKLALKSVKPTVMQKDLQGYFDWNNEFGTFNFTQLELNT